MEAVLGSKRKEEKGTSTYSTASFPLGFKFSPTDEQLIDHYLRLKNEGRGSEVQVIGEVDFYKYEPWDLPELSVIKSDQWDWFFFCRRDAVPDPLQFNPDLKDMIFPLKPPRPKLSLKHLARSMGLSLRDTGNPRNKIASNPANRIIGDSDSEISDIDGKIDSNLDSKIDGGSYPPDAKQLAWTSPAGYWKSTGNRSIQSAYRLLGMKKTLVFFKGRRTDWMMHEYSATKWDLVGTSPHQDAFVLCHLFLKGRVDDIKDDKIDDTYSSVITTSSSYADPHLFQKGRFDHIKDDKIRHTDSSVITTNSSYADPQKKKKNYPLDPNADPLDLLAMVALSNWAGRDWEGISRQYVTTRTPMQVASHANKYFLYQERLAQERHFEIGSSSNRSGHPATSSDSTPTVQLVPPGFYHALPAMPATTEEDNKESSLKAFAKQDLCLNSSTQGILLREAIAEAKSQGVVSDSSEIEAESALKAFAKQDLCLNSFTRGILLWEAFAEEGIEKGTPSESQGVVFDVEAVEMISNSGKNFEEIGAEFEASGQDKKFEIEEIGIEPKTSDMDWKTFSMDFNIHSDTIIQREVLQSCLMWGGLGLTEPPKDEDWENAKKIYLMDNELSVLPKNPRCPVLSTLFLQRNYKLRTIPPSFFDSMPALQILNLSRTGIKSLPESILRLVSLKRLFLNDCHRFMILSPKIGELKWLEVLDLEGTDIMDLPKEIKKLTNLTCLEVSLYAFLSNGRRAMPSDAVIPCSIISALSHLEELNISVNPDDKRWNECVEAIVTEVCTLVSLNTLKFYFPRVELLRHFLLNSPMWVHPSLSHFRFTVGHHVKRSMTRFPCDVEFELERWERCLKYINGVAVPREIKKVLQYSTAFFLERHATVKKLSDFGIGNMKQLKCCVVGECNEVEVIIDKADAHEEDSEADAHGEDDEVVACEEDDTNEIVPKTSGAKKVVLGALEYLCIYYMKNLRRIWEGPVQPKCLSLLKSLTLRTCPQLTTIFTKGLLDNLYNLEELTIEDCPSIKTLVSCEISAEHKTSEFLPNLKRISLHYMPGLVSISSGLHIAPRLEWMSFYNCPNLKHLLIEEVSSKDLKKIKGEWNWWVALKWRSGRPSYLDEIFVPINILDC